jgi:hypothetical protein
MQVGKTKVTLLVDILFVSLLRAVSGPGETRLPDVRVPRVVTTQKTRGTKSISPLSFLSFRMCESWTRGDRVPWQRLHLCGHGRGKRGSARALSSSAEPFWPYVPFGSADGMLAAV